MYDEWSDRTKCVRNAEDTRDALLTELEQAQTQLKRMRKRIRQLHHELRDAKGARVES